MVRDSFRHRSRSAHGCGGGGVGGWQFLCVILLSDNDHAAGGAIARPREVNNG